MSDELFPFTSKNRAPRSRNISSIFSLRFAITMFTVQ
jgi:hypothetical protein